MILYYVAFAASTTKAHPHRAGTCDAGNFGLGRFHGGTRQTLKHRNLVLKVDGENMYPGDPFEIKLGSHELTLTNTDGSTEFKGFFFRLQSVSGSDTNNMLLETSHFARRNPLCTQNITGIEHTSNTLKTFITVNLSPLDVGDYILDLHVVATKENDWVYDQYNITITSSNSTSISANVSQSGDSEMSASPAYAYVDKKAVGLIMTFSMLGFYILLSLFLFCLKIAKQNRKDPLQQEVSQMPSTSSFIQLTPLIV